MWIYKIKSEKFGSHLVKLSDCDKKIIQNLGGKWGVCLMRDKFYVQKRFPDGKVKQLHRFLLNPKKGDYVDHINGDTLDNRRENLRICNNAANLRNGRIRTNNTSGYKGVRWDKSRNKWVARIKVHFKEIYLGRYNLFEEAISARKKAEIKYWNV